MCREIELHILVDDRVSDALAPVAREERNFRLGASSVKS